MNDLIYKIFAIVFCTLVAGAIVWIIYDSVRKNKKTKVNGKK